MKEMQLEDWIADVADFPKPGIVFKDLSPLLADAAAFAHCLDRFELALRDHAFDSIVAIEARGFIFGAALAARRRCGFVPVRKPGKLPRATARIDYDLEYGQDALEMHSDALRPGSRVLLVDDVLATGGTAAAASSLIRRQDAQLVAAAFVLELTFLGGAERLRPLEPVSLLRY